MSKKLHHRKIKNTGILFELLTRQITVDILNNVKDPISVKLVKKYFNKNTQLGKERELYNLLSLENYKSERKAEQLIERTIAARQKLRNSELRREKYNLIKEIKENYNDVNAFFNARVPNFKLFASIYKVFQAESLNEDFNPAEVVNNKFNIVEHIMRENKKPESPKETILNEFRKEEKDLQLLAYKMLVDRFNMKYKSLTGKQKNLLREYINNISNTNGLREYVNNEVDLIKDKLTPYVSKIDNKVTRIKLKESLKQLDLIKKGNVVKDEQLVSLMRFYQLDREIKNVLSK